MSLTAAIRTAQNSLMNTARQTIVTTRNITEAHPMSVTEDNVTVAYVDREFISARCPRR